MTFMLLPTLFLPKNASTRRVRTHVENVKPCHVAQLEARPPVVDDGRDRLSKRIESLAKDRKIKAAVALVQAMASHPQEPLDEEGFAELTERLKVKFPSRREAIDVSVTPKETAPFAADQVITALLRMNRNAATCVDSWTRDTFMQAITCDRSIAEDLGVLLSMINNGVFGTLVSDCLRLGRLVAIPKREGGIRPIVVSSSFCRLCGTLVLARSQVSCSGSQFAINVRDGASRIVHLARDRFRKGKVILRFDSSNAFNVAPRARIRQLLSNEFMHPDLLRYFDTVYLPSSKLCVSSAVHKRARVFLKQKKQHFWALWHEFGSYDCHLFLD